MFTAFSTVDGIRGRKVLVTGAGGFIGPKVVKALVDRGAEVRALLGPLNESVRLLASPSIENCIADICDASEAERLTKGVDIVVHMAGPSSVAASFADPTAFARSHVLGTVTILEACRRNRVGRVVHISSAEVYGRPLAEPVGEDHPVAPRSPYGAAKAAGEHFVRVLASAGHIPAIILRPFNVYGPGAAPEGLFGTILKMARAGEAVTLQDLAPVRDFCYVGDVADAIVKACVAKVDSIETINVGSGVGISVEQFASSVVRALGRDIPILQSSEKPRPREAEIYRLIADARRAERLLTWRPETAIDAGIRASL
jgi:nucleoside-diphosphate-sugar epimerase